MERAQPAPTFKRALITVFLVLLILAAFYGIYRFNHILFTLFIAMVLGTLARPARNWLIDRGIHPHLATTILLILLLLLITGFILLLLPMLTSQYQTLISTIPKYYSAIRDWLTSSNNELVLRIARTLPASLNLAEPLNQNGQDPITTLTGFFRLLRGVVDNIFGLVVLLLLSYYWMVSGHQIITSSLFFIKLEKRQDIVEIVQQIETKLRQYLVGQGFLSISIAIMYLVVLLIFRMPNAFLLALIAGLFEAVPFVGPVLGALPAVLVALSISPGTFIWIVVLALLIQQIENNLLVPRIMDKVVGVNPFISILAIAAFTSLYGVGGAFMAIPLAAIIQLVIEHTLLRGSTQPTHSLEGRDKLTVLRYEIQDFIAGMQNQSRQPQPGNADTRAKLEAAQEEMEMVARDLDWLLARKAEGQNGK